MTLQNAFHFVPLNKLKKFCIFKVADVHVHSVALLPERDKVVDYLYPIAYTYDVFALRVDTTKNSYIWQPFTLAVWLVTGISILAISLTLVMTEGPSEYSDHFLTAFGIQLMNGEMYFIDFCKC